jgi:hypothetical protein
MYYLAHLTVHAIYMLPFRVTERAHAAPRQTPLLPDREAEMSRTPLNEVVYHNDAISKVQL